MWSDEWADQGSWREAIEDLRAEGLIRHFGVSINDHEPANALRLVESGAVETVQVILNVFDQSPEDELLPACREHDVGVIVRVPFDEGALTGRITRDTTFADGDFRSRYFGDGRLEEVHEHAGAILADLAIARDELPEIALRWILAHDEVSTVIPGMRSVRNVERNMAVSDGRRPAEEQLARLRAHRWVRNFYR